MTHEELTKEIAIYTGKKSAEEWYQSIFSPINAESKAKITNYVNRVNLAELCQIIRRSTWKKAEAKDIFEDVAQSLARSWGIEEKDYPQIILHEEHDAQGTNYLHCKTDLKAGEFTSVLVHFDIDGIIQYTPKASDIIGEIAHELVHLNQTKELMVWLRRHPYLRRDKLDAKVLRIIFFFAKRQKPIHLLQWLNGQIYVSLPQNEELYYKQLKEVEAFMVERQIANGIELTWRKCYGEEPLPAMI